MRLLFCRSTFPYLVFSALLAILCTQVHAQQAETLTNQSIVDLVKNGIDADVITKMIAQQPHHFDLSSTGIIHLKQRGVPQAVLKAMLNAKSGATSATKNGDGSGAPQAAMPSSRDKKPNYTWKLVTRNDPIAGTTKSTLVLDTPAVNEDGERMGMFEAQATCTSFQFNLAIVFQTDAKPGHTFKQNTTTYYETGGLLGAMANAQHHKKPWTETRVRVGDQPPVVATSEADYLNESDIYFLHHDPRETQQDGGLGFLGTMLSANKPAGLSGNFFSAQKVLLESVFDDGSKAVLELHPQDASFRSFAESCIPTENVNDRSPAGSGSAGAGGGLSAPSHSPDSSPAPRLPRTVLPAGSKLQVKLDGPITLKTARSGQYIHATLAEALPAGAAPAGETSLVLPAGTDVFLRGHIVGAGQQYQIRVDVDHIVLHGVNVIVRATSETRTMSRNTGLPRSINLGGFGRLNVPRVATNDDPVVIAKGDKLTFSLSQTVMVPSAASP